MNFFEAITLGIVQGLTEFLPVSSSGHLILARELFGWQTKDGLGIDAILQLATILAVVVVFRSDIGKLIKTAWNFVIRRPVSEIDKTLLGAILVGTLPALIFGLALESFMENVFRTPLLVASTLLFGSGIFWLAEKYANKTTPSALPSIKQGLSIGLFQTLALIPGISRSGATISGGLFLGLSREAATRFSFLLALPIITGSGFKKFVDLAEEGALTHLGFPLLVSFAVAFAVGLLAIRFLLQYLKRHTLNIFIWYRVALALAVFIMLAVKK